jgi:hypothetical protein
MRKWWCILAAPLLVSCNLSSNLKMEPSPYEVTRDLAEYADELNVSMETFHVHPIPYVTEGQATSRRARSYDWFLLYLEKNEFGKLAEGYAYQQTEAVVPILWGVETYVFDRDGKRIGARDFGDIGLYWPWPRIEFITFRVDLSSDNRTDDSFWDFGIKLLKLPILETSLFALGTDNLDLLYIPLWRKDRRPRTEVAGAEPQPASFEEPADGSGMAGEEPEARQ